MIEIDKIKPINGQILVIDDKKEEKTKGGIFLPDNAISRTVESCTGKVVAVSQTTLKNGTKINPEVKPGDKVFYEWKAGAMQTFKLEDGSLARLVRPEEILAVLT